MLIHVPQRKVGEGKGRGGEGEELGGRKTDEVPGGGGGEWGRRHAGRAGEGGVGRGEGDSCFSN